MITLKFSNIYFDTQEASFDTSTLPCEAVFTFEVKIDSERTFSSLCMKAVKQLEETHGLKVLDVTAEFTSD